MPMTIHGPNYSTYVRTVRLVLEEKGQPYELAEVDTLKGETKQHPHLGRHPFGMVPAFEHDGFELYETGAIIRYLRPDPAGAAPHAHRPQGRGAHEPGHGHPRLLCLPVAHRQPRDPAHRGPDDGRHAGRAGDRRGSAEGAHGARRDRPPERRPALPRRPGAEPRRPARGPGPRLPHRHARGGPGSSSPIPACVPGGSASPPGRAWPRPHPGSAEPMPHPPLRIAVLGLGMAVQPHARSLVELQEEGRVEVLGCWSRSAERRAAFAERHGLPVTGDLDGLLARPELDAALLLTPPDAREDLVTRLAQAGKHILAEKPVERTTAAAERIVATCEAAGVTLGTVFQFRFREVLGSAPPPARSGGAGRDRGGRAHRPLVAPAELLRRPWPRHAGPRRRRRAAHPGHPQPRPDAEPDAPVAEVAAVAGTSRIHRMETEDLVAGGLVFANGALGGLFATTAAYPGDPERLCHHRHQGPCDPGLGRRSTSAISTAAPSRWASPRPRAAVPIPWPSRTAGTRA